MGFGFDFHYSLGLDQGEAERALHRLGVTVGHELVGVTAGVVAHQHLPPDPAFRLRRQRNQRGGQDLLVIGGGVGPASTASDGYHDPNLPAGKVPLTSENAILRTSNYPRSEHLSLIADAKRRRCMNG